MTVCVRRCAAIARQAAHKVPDTPARPLRVEALGPHHDRNSFNSGVEPLDRYLRAQAGQEARKNIAAPFVLMLPDGAIGGYYTLSATAVKISELPADITRRLPRYPLVPATLLGRLAVDLRYRGNGYGRYLLADALHRAVLSEIASFAVVVDAKDEAARRFYERESFLPFPDQPMKLFRPMADLRAVFA
jgi:GNAT superfamily N-acetyltransferase